MNERENFLRSFHAARPGVTSQVFARGGTYARLAERVPAGRVLDLACGDGPMLRRLGDRATGVDFSADELALAPAGRVVQARAQELPFADRSFDAATCHLAFMLFDDIERVVAELARVLRPGAPFIALIGGGPTAGGRDAYHAFAERLTRRMSLGDRRASSEAGWHELFAAWRPDVELERWPVDLGGTFDEVWSVLSSTYSLGADEAERVREGVRAEFSGERVPCTFVTYLATVTL